MLRQGRTTNALAVARDLLGPVGDDHVTACAACDRVAPAVSRVNHIVAWAAAQHIAAGSSDKSVRAAYTV